MQRRVAAVVMRGGTSRAVFFHKHHLPQDPALRDRVMLAIFGGGDPYGRQIDGLGGAVSTTSKAAIIGAASAPDADVDYTFGQVSVNTPLVDYGGNCGDISPPVRPLAIVGRILSAVGSMDTVVYL